MRIDPNKHLIHDLKVHELLSDFRIEDVWHLPLVLNDEHSLALVQNQFSKSTNTLENRGLAGWLFRLRFYLGRLFNWDQKDAHSELIPGSIRERYAKQEELTYDQLPDPGKGDFIPVYNLEQESLSEIENATVHAAIHLSRVPMKDKFAIYMTIYVKPKGVFGQLYMWFIKPFRLFIVYPALMRSIKRNWENYVNHSPKDENLKL